MQDRNQIAEIEDEEGYAHVDLYSPSSSSSWSSSTSSCSQITRILQGHVQGSFSDFSSCGSDLESVTPPPSPQRSISPIEVIRFLFSSPNLFELTPLEKLKREQQSLLQVLSHAQCALKSGILALESNHLALNGLKAAAHRVSEGAGKNLQKLLQQQKIYLNFMRIMPYVPSTILIFFLLPAKLKSVGLISYFFSYGAEKKMFGTINYQVNRLSKIAEMQMTVFEKLAKVQQGIENLNLPEEVRAEVLDAQPANPNFR